MSESLTTDNCFICLTDLAGEKKQNFTCQHDSFHKECIDNWIQTCLNAHHTPTCPACRCKQLISSHHQYFNHTISIAGESIGPFPGIGPDETMQIYGMDVTPSRYFVEGCTENEHSIILRKPFGVVAYCMDCSNIKAFGYMG